MKNIEEVISYHANFIPKKEANELFEHLMEIEELTRMMEITTFAGVHFKFDFGKIMFLDKDLIEQNKFPETVWGHNRIWSEQMLALKSQVEDFTGEKFKTCVCIYYPDGNAGVDYHSDKTAYGDTTVIPAISLGEERQFCFRENQTLEKSSMVLNHGSLLIMKADCQESFQHSLPVDPAYKNPRISITFRKFGY
ncbi:MULTISPECIES: alpha-ketoglutarate-dependent dioxygenase AlkB [Aequorivita]|uniref:Alpha-ketoglutarate-dependent dioxygenase AlkB n=2 Tax=Aequorivita TaxID=153265 RepID=A0AB35YRE4_9FLAO|nr:alpha-ketoglutarate-dependent dioxygenase AlkB [Aequorivita sp. Ant34-E75]WGF93312.1 alpha-ketoglutarate-dependent dioxygenase AlkB [Aequorivita sp. Ant34-E75]